jgi:hypothetical protein
MQITPRACQQAVKLMGFEPGASPGNVRATGKKTGLRDGLRARGAQAERYVLPYIQRRRQEPHVRGGLPHFEIADGTVPPQKNSPILRSTEA